MLKVQQFLQHKSFKRLEEEHGVEVSFDKSGYKFSLNYNQISSKENDELACQCRGLILATADGHPLTDQATIVNGRLNYDNVCPGETIVLAYPFRRFLNYGQGFAAEINWKDPKLSVQVKLDGTLIILYYDRFKQSWCCATRSVPEADLIIDSGKYTFRTLFEKALFETVSLSFDDFTSRLDKEITYCFELTTPLNKIVVQYRDYRITLLGARKALSEIDISAIETGVPKVQEYSLSSIQDILEFVNAQNPLEMEGVVVKDSSFNRIKVKSAAYVLAHKTKDTISASPRNLLELILLEREDDVLPILPPETAQDVMNMKEKVHKFMNNYNKLYSNIILSLPANCSKKDFALEIQKQKIPWPATLFQMFDQKALSMKEFIVNNKKNGYSASFLDKILEGLI